MQRTPPPIFGRPTNPAQPAAVRVVVAPGPPARSPARPRPPRPAIARPRPSTRAPAAAPPPDQADPPTVTPSNYLADVEPIPAALADLFAAADDNPLLPAERRALAEAIAAAAARVREARAALEETQSLRGRRELRGPAVPPPTP